MPLTCPVCRANNDAGPNCRRCRADLSLLFALEVRREAELAAARTELAQGRADAAFTLARRADGLRQGADAARIAAAAALMRRDFAIAWHEYHWAKRLSGG